MHGMNVKIFCEISSEHFHIAVCSWFHEDPDIIFVQGPPKMV